MGNFKQQTSRFAGRRILRRESTVCFQKATSLMSHVLFTIYSGSQVVQTFCWSTRISYPQSFCFIVVHLGKPTWHWKIPVFNRKYIFNLVDFPLSSWFLGGYFIWFRCGFVSFLEAPPSLCQLQKQETLSTSLRGIDPGDDRWPTTFWTPKIQTVQMGYPDIRIIQPFFMANIPTKTATLSQRFFLETPQTNDAFMASVMKFHIEIWIIPSHCGILWKFLYVNFYMLQQKTFHFKQTIWDFSVWWMASSKTSPPPNQIYILQSGYRWSP